MTSMEQLIYIDAQAKKLGMKYGDYVAKYGHTHPKPDSVRRREIEYYDGIERKKPKPREGIKVVCECGRTFTAKRKDAKYCKYCKAEQGRLRSQQRRDEKKNAKIPKQKDHC